MIKFPVTLKQMVFLKRLWEELWKNEETPNITYDYNMVHSGKRDLVFDVQVLFLDALEIGKSLPLYRWQDLEKIRQNKLLELLVDEQKLQTVNEVRAEQATTESDFDREVC
ncbi:MAG: hypothetical protein KAQ99_05715 [Candidatus Aureabacteria bacterium]|nr:hypothetical protein [Candidatus Auribacterota bacterium]